MGDRPRRSAVDAVKETHRLICRGYTDVVDADLSKYFDTIPQSDLLNLWPAALSTGIAVADQAMAESAG